MPRVVLFQPEIPPNTGNVARSCAATCTELHLIEPLGFQIDDRTLKRAGLDYWDAVDFSVYSDLAAFSGSNPAGRKLFFSTSGKRSLFEAEFRPGDFFLFGNEVTGLPDALLEQHPDDVFNIPIRLDCVRSLNLSNCAAVVLYEALRKISV